MKCPHCGKSLDYARYPPDLSTPNMSQWTCGACGGRFALVKLPPDREPHGSEREGRAGQ